MDNFLNVLLITMVLMCFVFIGIGIKILMKRNGEFSGTCASQNPLINTKGESCSFCGALPEEKCNNEGIST